MKVLLICLCSVIAIVTGQRITTIQLDGVQYFVSRMNPYSPELNYFLAYQYCRSLGLQLASFETKEKVESMSQYLQNAGYSKYDFWTSGNRLGTGMFLWMSTGLPFNATFDYFENSNDAVQAGLLDPIDHNSNTSPQRTARDSSSGLEKGCIILQAPGLRWAPEDCSAVKDFICEQTRCYYYNYGSIPVSSAQGRPIIITTTTTETPTTRQYFSTPLPILAASTIAPQSPPPVQPSEAADKNLSPFGALKIRSNINENELKEPQFNHDESEKGSMLHESLDNDKTDKNIEQITEETELDGVPLLNEEHEGTSEKFEETTSVEQRLRKISEEIEKYSSGDKESDVGLQSFFSLSDLIKTLRPTDKKVIPQIDSDYSNTMRVLGETSSIVGVDEGRKVRDGDSLQTNRGHFTEK
ncbi:uncharacterized protein LOC119071702 isoform X1 [Bradysia coprophila]|uniref:uncharacterized protein LOC119071702 isoform X1 n=1 Tax=Bradysia coprophila TaxID=38358 RepID=UPI00187DBCC7|nr:uncharacterized protein LOC119071702 isoform X1 [Bradysia coprophila]